MSRGPEDPEECLDMAKQKKQTSEARLGGLSSSGPDLT